jgi:hypothetical protein
LTTLLLLLVAVAGLLLAVAAVRVAFAQELD